VRTATDLLASVATYGALWVVQYVVLDRALFARRPRRDIVSTPVAERDVARAPVAGGHVARTPVAGQLDQARS
ncbi:MAG: hypothetical protein ACLP7F_25110, partial [Acidimicrobiales bacterium]